METQEITLANLIEEQRDRIRQLRLKPDPPGCAGFSYYYYEDDAAYQKWLAMTKRVIGSLFRGDKDIAEFDVISKGALTPTQQKKLLAILEAFEAIPNIIESDTTLQYKTKNGKQRGAVNVITNVNNSNNNTQTQSVSIFIEAIKDDLTGKQVKELKEIVSQEGDDLEKAKPKILEKVISWGGNVAAGIVTNLLTNPAIWGGL